MKSAVTMSLVATLLGLLAANPAGADTCVSTKDSNARDELRAAPAGPQLLSTTYFFPAGAPVDIVLKEEYKSDQPLRLFCGTSNPILTRAIRDNSTLP
jgi:hypothetical protein